MTEPVLDCPRVMSGVCQSVAAAVPKHVRMDFEWETGSFADTLDKPIDLVRGEGTAALSGENVLAVRKLPLQLA
jgi:hypothetical protein